MILNHDRIVDLYVNQKLSTFQVARELGYKKNSVLQHLRSYGLLRKNLGYDIEQEVASWFEKRGAMVIRQPGDAPFDLLVNGCRYDVKSASPSGKKYPAYTFELQHIKERKEHKVHSEFIDQFLFVFKTGKYPMYTLSTHAPNIPRQSLHMSSFTNTAQPIIFLGNLRDENTVDNS